MDELLLILLAIIFLLIPNLVLAKLRPTTKYAIQLIGGIIFLSLVWAFGEGRIWPRIIITVLVGQQVAFATLQLRKMNKEKNKAGRVHQG